MRKAPPKGTCKSCGNPTSLRKNKRCAPCYHHSQEIPITERFWKYIEKSENCWKWIGAVNFAGYGQIGDGKGHRIASRLSWEIHFGPIPKGLWVLHKCDNPPCCNPKHLFLGTNADNMKDCKRKGRTCIGEKAPMAKLNASQVIEIRRLYKPFEFGYKKLGKLFHVDDENIRAIIQRRSWRHI